MLLQVDQNLQVAAESATAWALVSDVPRLAGLIPNIADLKALPPGRAYTAVVSDRLGPFKLSVPIQLELVRVEDGCQIVAQLTGADQRGQARVKGELVCTIEPASSGGPAGCTIVLGMKLEIVGKLAALGAAPMRRRADELFQALARRLQQELQDTPAASRTPVP